MTKEWKIEWLRNATVEEVLEQYKSLVWHSSNDKDSRVRIEATTDIQLVEAELKRRIGG